jgi:ribonuclease III
MADSASLDKLEASLGVTFKDRALLKEALTHRSYLNENPKWSSRHNERLEYLGDAVLELVVSEALYRGYPDADEGELTAVRAALVNYQSLAKLADVLGLGSHIRMSRGEARDKGRAREVIMANAMESVIGAMYLDAGTAPIAKIADEHLVSRAGEILATKSYKDPKSALQEMAQEKDRVTPTYRVLSEEGPAHQRTFTVGVYIGSKQVAEGTGPSKQEAEVEAASRALAAHRA